MSESAIETWTTIALHAVLECAQREGLAKTRIRLLVEEALHQLPEEGDKPACFGVAHSALDVLCAGGKDVSYHDGSGTRPQCMLFESCRKVTEEIKPLVISVAELKHRIDERRKHN